MRREQMAARGAALEAGGRAFVEATVVRAQRPTSVRPGDRAIVHPDGTVEGFVGGVCAEANVQTHALEALDRGEPLLLRILPTDGDEGDDGRTGAAEEGSVTVTNPCLSGGGIEIYLEPRRPRARLFAVGGTPVAEALAAIGAAMGEKVVALPAGAPLQDPGGRAIHAGDLGVVVAGHGRGEEAALRAAVEAGVPYVGLVASKRRGDAVRSALGLAEQDVARITSPAGLALGARTPEEIALAIWAEIVARRRLDGPPVDEVEVGGSDVRGAVGPARSAEEGATPAILIDPVCGMTVALGPDAITVETADGVVAFCGPGCRATWQQQGAAIAVRGHGEEAEA